MKRNYVGTYRGLMTTIAEIFFSHPLSASIPPVQLLGLGSIHEIPLVWRSIWRSHLSAQEVIVGNARTLRIMSRCCRGAGKKLVPRFGIRKFNLFGEELDHRLGHPPCFSATLTPGLLQPSSWLTSVCNVSSSAIRVVRLQGDSAGFQLRQHHFHDGSLFHSAVR